MRSYNRYGGAAELLTHFLPQHVLQELRGRALLLQKDEQFRIYLLRRLWFVIPIALVSVLIGLACTAGSMIFLFLFVAQPVPGWLVALIFGIGALVGVAVIVSQLYALLAWLERRAFSRTMSASLDLDALARELKRAQDSAAQLEPLTLRLPDLDLRDAYAVARRVHDARRAEGFIPVGRKIGFTNSSLWPVYGVHQPIWGTMYDRTVISLGSAEGRCSLRGLAEPRIEPEIVLGLRSAPEPGADHAALLRSIEWIAHGYEIVQSHFPGWKFRVADTVADNGLHGLLLLGPTLALSRLGADAEESLRSFSVALSCNGVQKEVGRGSNVLGSPLAALAHLISALASLPGSEPLRGGEMVTTGTLTAAYPVGAGETWETELRGIPLPGLRVAFTG